MASVLTADSIITPAEVLRPGWLSWEQGRITGIGLGNPAVPADLHLPSATVVPGFVDTHVHGGGGASFGGSPHDAARVVAAHRARGTTTLVASLVTATVDDLVRQVADLAELADDDLVAGIHLEGPWLSPLHHGAHDPSLLRTPDRADLARVLAAGRGHVRMVTLAPELDNGLEAVRQIVDAGAVAAVGHSDASYETTRAAVDAGAKAGTHVHNAMRALHHREPGPVPALLGDPAVYAEAIADGVHLHPAVVSAMFRSPAAPVLVSDAMAAAGAVGGDYLLGGLAVEVRDSVARIAGTETIAGSTLTLERAVRYAAQTAGVPVVNAVRAATLTPADLIGRRDLGRLEIGARADLVVLDDDLTVTGVLARGEWVS